ncbi:MAG: hypothetical protein JRL30_25750 [Deltaproteobacteria bacterium]|nr:hypothetical protein [Deltaproteobacteria bacterium]
MLLLVSYWMGIIADAMATVLLFLPSVANAVLQPQPFEMSDVYLYVTRVAGALMMGWTVLLLWAVLRPIERSGILLITLVPVVTLLAVSAVLVAKSHQIPISKLIPMFCFYGVAYCTYIPSYVWARKQRCRV